MPQQNNPLLLQRFICAFAAGCKSGPSRFLYGSVWDWQLATFFFHSVSEDNYETKIIRA